MATKLYDRKGYSVCLANLQPSKIRRGGTTRTIQVMDRNNCVVKQFRYKFSIDGAMEAAQNKASDWIDLMSILR